MLLTKPNNQLITPQQRLSVSSLATIYGGCGLFGLCGSDDLISLTMAGTNQFFDWIRWVGTNVHLVERNFVHWVRPSESPRVGYVSDPCADPNTVQFGTATFRYEGFGRLRRSAPVTDVTTAYLKYCERQPRYRFDGTVIDNDIEYRALLAAQGVSQDIHALAVVGNKSTAGQFDGLERLVKTGYTDANGRRVSSMDSIVIDWNNNTMAGGSGATWDDGRVGTISIPSNQNIVDVLRDAFTQIKARLKLAPTLGAEGLVTGDVIIMGTSEAMSELMDQFTFWSLEPGRQYHEISYNNLESRNFRDRLDGGLFGDGRIFFKSFEIPLLAYDWELQKGPTRSDIYMLVRSVGSTVLLEGQYNDFTTVARNHNKFQTSDGGRFLHWEEDDHTCLQQVLELQPRIISWAPWTNVRIQNVTVTSNNGHMSPDPLQTSFFPETSFIVAAC